MISKIEGAFVQGLGYVTTEQLLIDSSTGEILTDCPGTYKIPTAADVPKDLVVSLLDNGEGPTGPVYSSKGIGEPPLLIGTTSEAPT